MQSTINRNLLQYHVQQVMFCPACQDILDMRRAVSMDVKRGENTVCSLCVCTSCYDQRKEAVEAAAAARGLTVEVLDGRKLFQGGR
jgi:hypothetical protein